MVEGNLSVISWSVRPPASLPDLLKALINDVCDSVGRVEVNVRREFWQSEAGQREKAMWKARRNVVWWEIFGTRERS